MHTPAINAAAPSSVGSDPFSPPAHLCHVDVQQWPLEELDGPTSCQRRLCHTLSTAVGQHSNLHDTGGRQTQEPQQQAWWVQMTARAVCLSPAR
jgi:hypothetical protein